jgi:hypothetical protein
MSRSVFSHLRLVGPLTVAAALGIGALPAMAQTAPMGSDCSAIRFDLSNPSPGSMIAAGGLVVQGVATDSRAMGGNGIDRVDFFLDSRDQGGMSVGSAVPGAVAGPFGAASFQTTVTIPNLTGGHDLVAYAHSNVSGAEIVISVPVAINEDPVKAGEVGVTASETCRPGTASTTPATTTTATTPATTTTPVSPPAVAPTTPTTTMITSPTAASITLQVSNPSPGDTIHVGGYGIQGMAFDKSAPSGSGIDRIDIFLDSRDSGGMMLTETVPGASNMWQVILPLPTNQTGLHTLYFYAHSSVSGQESVVSVPVTIAP